jgi:transposase
VVVDAYRFRIIRDSWSKSDRRDASNLSQGLWLPERSRGLKLPEVWQPDPVIRELRRLYGQYEMLNKQITQLKNQVHGILLDNGVMDRRVGDALVKNPEGGLKPIAGLELTEASRLCIRVSLELVAGLERQKSVLQHAIYRVGEPLKPQVELLIGIRGVTPLLALVFLAEVGDIRRSSSAPKLSGYLGTVPRSRSSGGVTHSGHINRASRHLARSMFSQAIPHMVDSSAALESAYRDLARRKGYGRARIAIRRRMFTIMRRMLLDGTQYRWLEPKLYAKKMREYHRVLAKKEGTAEAA